jgi:hypothetical protein
LPIFYHPYIKGFNFFFSLFSFFSSGFYKLFIDFSCEPFGYSGITCRSQSEYQGLIHRCDRFRTYVDYFSFPLITKKVKSQGIFFFVDNFFQSDLQLTGLSIVYQTFKY